MINKHERSLILQKRFILRSFRELHESLNKGDQVYSFSLEKAKEESLGDPKKFTQYAACFTGNTKPRIKSCSIFQKILENLMSDNAK